MKHNVDFTIPALGIPLFLAIIFNLPACYKSDAVPKRHFAYVSYFQDGQVLEPDYVCPDTLVVLDSKGLNIEMGLVEQGLIEGTDAELHKIVHKYCKIK